MKAQLLPILITLTSFIAHEVNGQQKQLSVTYYPGTKIKKVEYEYVSGKAGTASNIQIRDDKTKLLKSVDQNSYSINSMTPHGFRKEYYPNGTLSKVLNYNYGVKQGLAKEYYETGVLKNQYNFNNDIIDGEFSEFYENGKLQSKCTYVNGMRTGKSIVNDEEGKPYIYLNYLPHESKDGSPVKVSYQTKYDNGKTLEEGFLGSTYSQDRFPFSFYYDDFMRQGKFTTYEEDGTKRMEAIYKNNAGTSSTSFYPSGNKKEEKTYQQYETKTKIYTVVDGPYKEYYENGQLAKSGTIKTWGTPSKTNPDEIESEEYKAGDWKEYDQAGKVVRFTSYGQKDQVLLDMDQKAIDEQSNISESLDFNTYKSRSIDMFGKYLRFHYGGLIAGYEEIPASSRQGLIDDTRSKALKVFDEFNAALARCTTKDCVKSYSSKLDRIYQRMEELRSAFVRTRDYKPFLDFAQKVDETDIKSALGVN